MRVHAPIAIPSRPGGVPLGREAPPFGNRPPPTFFASGAEIYTQGERCRSLYLVQFGGVRICRILPDGRRQIPAFHLAGEMFGFEHDGRHHFCAEATCGTGLQILGAAHARTANDVLPMALQTLLRAQEHLLVLGRQNAIERIAAFLLEMSDRQSGLRQVELPMSRSDIADYLGLTIETVSRGFSKLKAKGVIKLPSLRSVEIVNLQALRQMAG